MRAVLPVQFGLIRKPQVGLVHERRWLKGVLAILPSESTPSQTTQFIVDNWNQAFECGLISISPIEKETGDVAWIFGDRIDG
jgi:hypothetical protein